TGRGPRRRRRGGPLRRRPRRRRDRAAPPGRPRQGHRLHRGQRARARGRARRRGPRGHRRRPQGPRHARPDRDHRLAVRRDRTVTVALGASPRIAIVKLSALGDVINALPVAWALRHARPDAHLTWIVEVREQAVLRGHPGLDEVVAVDTRRWRRLVRRPAGARQVWDEIRALRRRLHTARFDAAIDLQGNLKSGILTASSGAPLRIGFSAAWCRERLNTLFTNRRVTP